MTDRPHGFLPVMALAVAAATMLLGAILNARVRLLEESHQAHLRASAAWIGSLKELNPGMNVPSSAPFEEAAK